MPVTKEQAQTLVALIAACRPYGATRWDTPGIYAAIGRVKDRALSEVIHAFVRGAEDRTADTPAVVVTNPTYWTDPSPERPTFTGVRHSPNGCQICGLDEANCRRSPKVGDDTDHDYQPRTNRTGVSAS